jgi:hypothetical protein
MQTSTIDNSGNTSPETTSSATCRWTEQGKIQTLLYVISVILLAVGIALCVMGSVGGLGLMVGLFVGQATIVFIGGLISGGFAVMGHFVKYDSKSHADS